MTLHNNITLGILRASDRGICVGQKWVHALQLLQFYRISYFIVKNTSSSKGMIKVFNCPVHGHIELSYLSTKIIDTPQFQRLRDVAQLGSIYYVFGAACTKRFEHSLGVAHLARSFIRRLREQQPEFGISEIDCLCVEIAGLCHDLGHGIFSHLFDSMILPKMGVGHNFHHEHASIGILHLLIEENDLMPIFHENGMSESDIHFIQELILGDSSSAPESFQWVGKPPEKMFMYDIVANKWNGIDVDRFDYFARDCLALGMKSSFDSSRLMKFSR